MENFHASYDANYKGYCLGRIQLNVTGMHNILNSLLAVSMGLELDIPFKNIQKGLSDYKGVYRRFELKAEVAGITIFDDYAHHPTEITATLEGFRESTKRRIVVIFQPHLFSRTRDFHKDFGKAFFSCDTLILAPIYPAREQAIPGVTSKLIADAAIQCGHHNVTYVEDNKDIVDTAFQLLQEGDVVVTMGAGNIWQYGEELISRIRKEKSH